MVGNSYYVCEVYVYIPFLTHSFQSIASEWEGKGVISSFDLYSSVLSMVCYLDPDNRFTFLHDSVFDYSVEGIE